MKVTILGAGAMGALVGGYLQKGGEQVFFVDPYAAHMDAVEKNGLRMSVTGKEPEVVRIAKATTSPEEVGESDVVIVLVKGQDTERIVRDGKALFGPDTVVISLQNGDGNVETLLGVFPEENVGFGVIAASATITAPGVISGGIPLEEGKVGIYFTGHKDLKKYEAKYAALDKALNAGGFHAKYTPEANHKKWEKLYRNVLFNLPCAITRVNMENIWGNKSGGDLLQKLGEEVCAVAAANGVTMDPAQNWGYAQSMCEDPSMGPNFPSAAQDMMKKRSTEVEYLNGVIVRYGRRFGIPTPYNDAVCLMAHVLQETYEVQYS